MAKTLTWIVLLLCGCAFAQYGSAPNGYYPRDYNGSTFTGTVTGKDPAKQEITLTYENKKKNKSESFVGELEGPCQLPTGANSTRPVKAEEIPDGTVLTAFYNTKYRKENGKKTETNQIIMIQFEVLDGKPVPSQNKAPIYCRGTSKK